MLKVMLCELGGGGGGGDGGDGGDGGRGGGGQHCNSGDGEIALRWRCPHFTGPMSV